MALEQSTTETGIAALVRGIAANQHARVLVVGGKGDNFPEPYRSHPQLVFWDSKDSEQVDRQQVPMAVKLVLVTRFIRHETMARLRALHRDGRFEMVMQMMGTGQIKDMLQPIVDREEPVVAPAKSLAVVPKQAPPATPPAPPPARKRFGRGELQSFVRANARGTGGHMDEARRLLALAYASGYTTTENSLAQAIGQLRAGKLGATPAPKAPAAAPAPTAALAIPGPDDDVDLMRMLDDMAAAVALIRETLEKRAERRVRLKQLLKDI